MSQPKSNNAELDELLAGIGNIPLFENPSDSPIIQQPKEFANFKKIETRAKSRAKKTVKGLIKNYLSPEMLDDEYLKIKVSLDIDRLTDVLYVLETSKWAITSLMEEIDSGAKRAMDFDSLSKLQKQNLETMKTEKGLRQILEDEYKRFAETFTPKQQDTFTLTSGEEGGSEDGKIRTRGHKSLVAMLQEAEKEIKENSEAIIVSDVEEKPNETI